MRAVAPLGLAALLIGCTSTPVHLAPTVQTLPQARQPHVLAQPSRVCGVQFGPVQDLRREPRQLGVISGRAVQAPDDTDAWIRSALQTLDQRGVTTAGLAGDAAPAGTGLYATAVLRQFWVTSISTNKAANLVLDLKVRHGDTPVLEKSYRGARTVTNWASGEGEVQRLIDATWANALDQIGVDLQGLCGS